MQLASESKENEARARRRRPSRVCEAHPRPSLMLRSRLESEYATDGLPVTHHFQLTRFSPDGAFCRSCPSPPPFVGAC